MFTRTLVLNINYQPCKVVDWKDAVTSMFNGKVEVLAQYNEVLAHIDRHTLATFPELKQSLRQVIGTDVESLDVKVPAVIVLKKGTRQHKGPVRFTKANVCVRDGFSCAYCCKQLPISRLTFDHAVPKSKGGRTTWENIVMACHVCNLKKSNLTPQEAGLTLHRFPVKPKSLPVNRIFQLYTADSIPDEWKLYINW